MSYEFEDIKPGDLITSNFMKSVINAIESLDGRVIKLEGAPPEDNKVVITKFQLPDGKTVKNSLNSDGIRVEEGTHYAKLSWMGEEYVALNGKSNKIAKLLIEQVPSDQKILMVGETWNIVGGWTLSVKEIDIDGEGALVGLSKDGIELDDTVLSVGEVYTFTGDVLDENEVPLFVTYIDNIYSDLSDKYLITLKYTWAIDNNAIEL